MTTLFRFALLVFLTGCAVTTRPPEAPVAGAVVISSEQIRASDLTTASELIRELHPEWLAERCEVYLDRFGDRGLAAVKGDPALLRDIPLSMIEEIRYGAAYHEKNFVRKVAVIDIVTRVDESRP